MAPGHRWLGVTLSFLAFISAHFGVIAVVRGVPQAGAALPISCLLALLAAAWAAPLAMVLPWSLPGAAYRRRQRATAAIYLTACALWGVLCAVAIASFFLQH